MPLKTKLGERNQPNDMGVDKEQEEQEEPSYWLIAKLSGVLLLLCHSSSYVYMIHRLL
jgi:hypothetical protein